MISKVISSAVLGVDAYLVEVEVDIHQGLPSFSTVGLAEGALRESKERVRAAVTNSGYAFPADRITVNLAPADVKKEGSAFDLPIAVGILAATGLLPHSSIHGALFLGELSLDGLVRPVKGVLPMTLAARNHALKALFLPTGNAPEAAVVDGVTIYPVERLSQVVQHLSDLEKIRPHARHDNPSTEEAGLYEDLQDVRGQEHAKRALEIAAAGGHNLLMIGPPGSGKTMLARRLPSILPALSFEEALETSKVYSVLGLMPPGRGLIRRRPFRAPHHSISDAGLVGGGQVPRPGEVSLAHHGVLFLDELPEFRRNVLELLRQPMEEGMVVLSRASATVTYPASFMLVAAMNPCPCGFLGDPKRSCACTPPQIQRYRSKISGPLLDRIDIHLEVPAVPYRDLSSREGGTSSAQVREKVLRARDIQSRRFRRKAPATNARMSTKEIRRHCPMEPACENLLETAMERLGLSARAHARILKISRTIADLEGSERILPHHVAEAIQYRSLDRAMEVRLGAWT